MDKTTIGECMWQLGKIPKIIHFYWGSPQLSWLRYLTVWSFKKFNPDWEIRFYYPKKVYTGGPVWNQGFAEQVTGENWFDKLKDIPDIKMIELDFDVLGIGHIPDVFRSDIMRLKLLGTDGGVWSDIDILYFKSMNEVCFNNIENSSIDTVISYNNEPCKHHYSIGFLMSSVNNPFYMFLYEQTMKEKQERGEYQHLGVVLWKKFFPEPSFINNRFPNLNVYDIKMWLCYYYNSFDIERILIEDLPFNDSRTIGLHFYAGHPDIVYWESILSPDTYKNFNNTIISTIRRLYEN